MQRRCWNSAGGAGIALEVLELRWRSWSCVGGVAVTLELLELRWKCQSCAGGAGIADGGSGGRQSDGGRDSCRGAHH